jgi:hypothetical protein
VEIGMMKIDATQNQTKGRNMKKQMMIFLAMWMIALSASAQEIDKLAWMTGTWTQVKENDSVQESWLGPRGKMMIGSNLTHAARRGTTFEFLRIVEEPNGLSYLASPGGKPPVEFKMKEMGDKKVIFENLANDFPHRIIYLLEADGAMKARIEGSIQGKERSIEWRFERTKQ